MRSDVFVCVYFRMCVKRYSRSLAQCPFESQLTLLTQKTDGRDIRPHGEKLQLNGTKSKCLYVQVSKVQKSVSISE